MSSPPFLGRKPVRPHQLSHKWDWCHFVATLKNTMAEIYTYEQHRFYLYENTAFTGKSTKRRKLTNGSFHPCPQANSEADILFYFILFFNFTILYLFCHISTWIRHRYTRVPHPEPYSLLPPRTIPLGCPSVLAPSIQYCASNLDWRLVSYMILYMFQCHSPKSSHPLSLPQSP